MSNLSNVHTLRVIRASSPEALATILRAVTVPMEVMSFGQDELGNYAYYRTDKGMEKRVMFQMSKALREISRGGEAGLATGTGMLGS